MTRLAIDLSLRLHAFMLDPGTTNALFAGGILQGDGILTPTTILGLP